MLQVLMAAFMSFAVLGGTYVEADMISTYANDPSISITTGVSETRAWMNGVIGRHEYLDIKSYEDIGYQQVQQLSQWYNGVALENFTITDTYTVVKTSTISTTEKIEAAVTKTLGAKTSFSEWDLSDTNNYNTLLSIESTTTYSTSVTDSLSIKYDVKREYAENKVFALVSVAKVYKVYCETWQIDNFWWGDYEVKDSRKSYISYLIINPFVTVGYQDGTFIGKPI